MSFLDRIAAAVTPAASEESRAEARRNVEALAADEPWIRTIVSQHEPASKLPAPRLPGKLSSVSQLCLPAMPMQKKLFSILASRMRAARPTLAWPMKSMR